MRRASVVEKSTVSPCNDKFASTRCPLRRESCTNLKAAISRPLTSYQTSLDRETAKDLNLQLVEHEQVRGNHDQQ